MDPGSQIFVLLNECGSTDDLELSKIVLQVGNFDL